MMNVQVCKQGKAIDQNRLDTFRPLFDEIIGKFNTTWTTIPDKSVYYAQMSIVAAKALAEFNPSKVKGRKAQPGESEERKASKLASAVRKAEKEWVLKHLSSMYCKLGRPIDGPRIAKYEPFVRSIIPKFLPACKLFEASMEYDDLCNQLRYEVMLALRDGFDPVKAMAPAKNVKNPAKTAANQERKLANPEHTLEKAEKRSVYERLKNYMRRVRWKFHPETIGGRSVSYEAVLTETNLDMDGVANDGFVSVADHGINRAQVSSDIEALLQALEDGCDVKEIYAAMSLTQQEELREYLYTSNERTEELAVGELSGEVDHVEALAPVAEEAYEEMAE